MNKLSPEQQAIQIVSTWKAIDEPQRTDSLLRYYIVLAIKDAACDADHCTPEERAVIEAGLTWWCSRVNDDSYLMLGNALDVLLAARARKGEVGDGRA